MTRAEKERIQIVQLCTAWHERSGLNIPHILARIQNYGIDMERNRYVNLFVRLDRTPNIEPDIILAVIAAFTERLTSNERCTIEEAMEFAALARLPYNRLDELKSYFVDAEFEPTAHSQESSKPEEPKAQHSDFQDKANLVDALLMCSAVQDRSIRDQIVDNMPSEIRNRIERSNTNQVDVMSIVNKVLDYPNGFTHFLEIVRFYEGNTVHMDKVDTLADNFV